MKPSPSSGRLATLSLGLLLALGGCAVTPPQLGTPQSAVLQAWGTPTARHLLPQGASRLEYATGPYGRTTWMVDLDATGRVSGARQVLDEAEFLAVQSAPALRRDELLRWLGTPGERRAAGRAGGEVWSWRFSTLDCRWFEASVADDGRVTHSGYGIDPMCWDPAGEPGPSFE